jgi:hypothetical protein
MLTRVGDTFQAIVDVEATAEEADELADRVLDWLVEIGELDRVESAHRNEARVEGLEVVTRRTVFWSLTGEQELGCPSCGWTTAPEGFGVEAADGAWRDVLGEAVGTWYEGGPDRLACLRCHHEAGLNDWHWSPPWGFGYLGFRFWGWPPFRPEFLAELAALLGHRTVHPYGKL